MSVIHILKDGSRPTDITGHIVRLEDAEPLYRLLSRLHIGKKNEVLHNGKEKRNYKIS